MSFDDFTGNEILNARQMQDYQSVYLDLYADFRREQRAEKESIAEDVVFEIELIKQVEISVDYILMLVQQYRDAKGDGDDSEIRMTISRAVDSSPSLRNKKDLIESFVDSVTVHGDVGKDWQAFIATKRAEELRRIIEEENLDAEATQEFIEIAFRDGVIHSGGTAITRILPPVSRFMAGGNHGMKKQTVLDKFGVFFDRFFRLG